jgi:hypothetical protein
MFNEGDKIILLEEVEGIPRGNRGTIAFKYKDLRTGTEHFELDIPAYGAIVIASASQFELFNSERLSNSFYRKKE